MVHNERAGFPQPLMPDEIRGAKRGSVVGSRRLDIDLFKGLNKGDELLWLDTYCPDMSRKAVQDAIRSALNPTARTPGK